MLDWPRVSGADSPYLVFATSALAGLLYRIVLCCPPTPEDFRSYEAVGQPYDRRD